MENLGIDGKLLLAQLVNFALFFYLVKKYIAKPFLKFLTEEKHKEEEKEVLLNKIKKSEEDFQAKEIKLKADIKKQLTSALDDASLQGQKLKEEIIADAKKEAELIKEKAHKEIKEERESLYREVKNKVADLSVMVAEKTLSEYLDDDARKKITSKVVKNLNSALDKK